MKKPWLAFVLNFFLPGAGLCYLDHWRWGLLNFLLVQVSVAIALTGPELSVLDVNFHYLLLILAAGSAGIAHAVAWQERRGRGEPQSSKRPAIGA